MSISDNDKRMTLVWLVTCHGYSCANMPKWTSVTANGLAALSSFMNLCWRRWLAAFHVEKLVATRAVAQ